MADAPSRHCTGCGLTSGACAGACGRDLDPPRFCPECGRRLTVYVTPAHFTAACRDHGEVGPFSPPA
ncbi:MAG: hypothetical protein H0W70_14705 [Actinobacteria bacterium]|nr:hypothetical protein [Actinomycetota bacterium]